MLEPEDVLCTRCGAKPGYPCKTSHGERAGVPHKIREADARWRTHEIREQQ